MVLHTIFRSMAFAAHCDIVNELLGKTIVQGLMGYVVVEEYSTDMGRYSVVIVSECQVSSIEPKALPDRVEEYRVTGMIGDRQPGTGLPLAMIFVLK